LRSAGASALPLATVRGDPRIGDLLPLPAALSSPGRPWVFVTLRGIRHAVWKPHIGTRQRYRRSMAARGTFSPSERFTLSGLPLPRQLHRSSCEKGPIMAARKHPAWPEAVQLLVRVPRNQRMPILDEMWSAYDSDVHADVDGTRITRGTFIRSVLDQVEKIEAGKTTSPPSS